MQGNAGKAYISIHERRQTNRQAEIRGTDGERTVFKQRNSQLSGALLLLEPYSLAGLRPKRFWRFGLWTGLLSDLISASGYKHRLRTGSSAADDRENSALYSNARLLSRSEYCK